MKKLTKYLVGGAVRDQLLGIKPKDHDYVVVGATPQIMIELGFKQVGNDFPVFIEPATKEEYALARKEIKSGKGYKGFKFDFSDQVTLEEDLIRRDLTINAIARDEKGQIIAPHSGLDDLKNKILRHVSSHFCEDPLRVLRVARFQAQLPQFTLAPETKELLTKMSTELPALTPDRIFMELKKALQTTAPTLFFKILDDCNALREIFPELEALKGIPQAKKYHPEGDAWTHTLLALKEAAIMSQDLATRFAVLVHDLGKAQTPKSILPKHTGHEERGVKIINQLCSRLPIPNKLKELAIIVSRYHFQAHQVFDLRSEEILQMLKGTHALKKNSDLFSKFINCCIADDKGKLSQEYPQASFLQSCAVALNDLDLKPITTKCAGKKISDEITKLQMQKIDQLLEKGKEK